ncbi:aldose 1-epimerase [Georgenia sp. SYP-B2076]|uniref:aldose 1-epimerase n=1 Tax=Georgenia sp. SYP-B2076 TaxID=2495881 RepID=UPI000F8F724D|nr:aldose 1-epimerase [Georgenia sp. SYP-B2076]
METASAEARATVERGALDGEPTWTLTHPDGARLVVAETGATVLAWQAPGRDGALVDLIDGYTSGAEIAARDGYRGAVLAPWSNRVRDARYVFGGVSHDLAPGETDGREALHGLVTAVRWTRAQAGVRDSDRVLHLTATLAPGDHPGYPFALELSATYSLGIGAEGEARLGLELVAANVGDTPAPVALGWHPYLRLPGHATIDDLEVTVPARARVLTDESLIPLPGEQAYAGTAAPVRFAPLAGVSLDDAFTGLVPDDDGVVATVLRSPRTGESLTVEQEPFQARVVHVFTGDILERGPRASLAVEPCQLMTDAFNRADSAEGLVLAPGEQRQLVSDIVYRRG